MKAVILKCKDDRETYSEKRLVKSPKMYIRDTGLLHSLLSIRTSEDLFGNPVAGSSWEGFVIEQILSIIPLSWAYFFYRTGAGTKCFSGKETTFRPHPFASYLLAYHNYLS